MKIGGIIKNDFSSAPNVCTSIFLQGCPIKCEGCHNPELQSFNGGREIKWEEIYNALTANNIKRNLCIMGGEPLCKENLKYTRYLIEKAKKELPNIKIYVWTGYTLEYLKQNNDEDLLYILSSIDYLIDGPFILAERDITLHMRGSRNQRIIKMKN